MSYSIITFKDNTEFYNLLARQKGNNDKRSLHIGLGIASTIETILSLEDVLQKKIPWEETLEKVSVKLELLHSLPQVIDRLTKKRRTTNKQACIVSCIILFNHLREQFKKPFATVQEKSEAVANMTYCICWLKELVTVIQAEKN